MKNHPSPLCQFLHSKGIRLPIFVTAAVDHFSVVRQSLFNTLTSMGEHYHCVVATDVKLIDSLTKDLGAEAGHIIYDMQNGFDLNGFLALSGKMQGGSILFLLAHEPYTLLNQQDETSLKWMNHSYADDIIPITTPIFNQHLLSIWQSNVEFIIKHNPTETDWKTFFHSTPLALPKTFFSRPDWVLPDGTPTKEQTSILRKLREDASKISLLISKRGRGKSYTVATFIESLAEHSISFLFTAPKKSLAQFSTALLTHFISPDALSSACYTNIQQLAKWLIVDEAAMFPIAQLEQCFPYFDHILLATTLEGYEGSGHGIRLKLSEKGYDLDILTLYHPIRFANQDPLEHLTEALYLSSPVSTIDYFIPSQRLQNTTEYLTDVIQRRDTPQKLSSSCVSYSAIYYSKGFQLNTLSLAKSLYCFFAHIHYQTSPNDMRRLLDAPHQHFFYQRAISNSINNHDIIAAAWVLEEGGADKSLAEAIWQGIRRPKGSLVAQALAIHSDGLEMTILESYRISRIGIDPLFRRKKLAHHLILEIINFARSNRKDFLSVSFGFEPHLLHLWHHHGFRLTHISHRADASSGQLSCMMIYPLSEKARSETIRLSNDLFYLNQFQQDSIFSIETDSVLKTRMTLLNKLVKLNYVAKPNLSTCLTNDIDHLFDESQMRRLLIGFAHYKRSFEATRLAFFQLINRPYVSKTDPISILLHSLLVNPAPNKNEISHLKILLIAWLSLID